MIYAGRESDGGIADGTVDQFGGPRRYGSVSDVPYPDSNVLRKVASLTLAEQQQQSAALAKGVAKPKFLPEKLDFRIYEKFEGTDWTHYLLVS